MRLVMVIIVILDDGSDEFVYVTEVDIFALDTTKGFQLNVDFWEYFGLQSKKIGICRLGPFLFFIFFFFFHCNFIK